jgi:hypothetical protein
MPMLRLWAVFQLFMLAAAPAIWAGSPRLSPPPGPIHVPSPFDAPNNAPNVNPFAAPQHAAAAPNQGGNPQPVAPEKKTGVGGAVGGAIAGGTAGLLLGLLLWVLRKTAQVGIKIDPITKGVVAEFPRGLCWLMSGLGAFIPVVMTIVLLVVPPAHGGGTIVVVVIILLFAALGFALAWTLWKTRAIATDEGILSDSGWRGRRRLKWAELQAVNFLKRDASIQFLGATKKQQIRLPIFLAGLKPFTERMRKFLPPERYANAREILERIDRLNGGEALTFMNPAKPAAPQRDPKPT